MVDRHTSKYRKIGAKAAYTARDRRRIKFWEYKEGLSCVVCGNSNPLNLDFDHVDRSTKSFLISQAVTNGTPWTLVEKELEKCVPMCRNCHNIKSIIELGKLKNIDYERYVPENMKLYIKSQSHFPTERSVNE